MATKSLSSDEGYARRLVKRVWFVLRPVLEFGFRVPLLGPAAFLTCGLLYLWAQRVQGTGMSVRWRVIFCILALLYVVLIAVVSRRLKGKLRETPSGRPPPIATNSEQLAFVIALLVLTASLMSYRSLDKMLTGFHVQGAARYGIGSLTSVGLPSALSFETRFHQRCETVATWAVYVYPSLNNEDMKDPRVRGGERETPCRSELVAAAKTREDQREPFRKRPYAALAVLALMMAVDSLGITSGLAVVAALVIIWLRRTFDAYAEHINKTARLSNRTEAITVTFRRYGVGASYMLAAATLADWSENVLSVLLVKLLWPQANAQTGVAELTQREGSGWISSGLSASLARGASVLLSLSSLTKIIMLLGVLAYITFAVWVFLVHGGDKGKWKHTATFARSLIAVRIPLATVLILAFLLTTFQVPEITWRWQNNLALAATGSVMAVALGLTLYALSAMLLNHAGHIRHNHPKPRSSGLWVVALCGVPLLATAILAFATGEGWSAAWLKSLLPLAFVLLISIGGQLMSGWNLPKPAPPGMGKVWLPPLLGAMPPALLGLAALAANVRVYVYAALRNLEQPPSLRLLFAPALLLLVAAGVIALTGGWARQHARAKSLPLGRRLLYSLFMYPRRWGGRPHHWAGVLIVTGSVWLPVALLLLSGGARLYDVTGLLGTTGVTMLALALGCAAFCGIVGLVTTLMPLPEVFRPLGFAQMPVLTMLGLWWLGVAFIPPEDAIHDVRITSRRTSGPSQVSAQGSAPPLVSAETVRAGFTDAWMDTQGSAPPAVSAETVETAFKSWREKNCLLDATIPQSGDITERPAVPLVLISTDGGGIRAAAWTSYVLDRVLGYAAAADNECGNGPAGRPRAAWVFAMSGISGGSVGMATYTMRSLSNTPFQDQETCRWGPPSQALGCPISTPPARTRGPLAEPQCSDGCKVAQPACTPIGSPSARSTDGWIRTHLGACDPLAATVAWMLLIENPRSFIRVGKIPDRAAVLEQMWEQIWHSRDNTPGLFSLRDQSRVSRSRVPAPLLLMNGTSVETGCRFNGSVLTTAPQAERPPDTRSGINAPSVPEDDAPAQTASRCLEKVTRPARGSSLAATVDLAGILCDHQDMRLSTVAILSARWPFISPAGRMPKQCQGGGAQTAVVDGGYVDGTGSSTIIGIWNALAPLIARHNIDPQASALIVPHLIQISNGYHDAAAPNTNDRTAQLLVPPRTLARAYFASHATSSQQLQLLFSQPFSFAYRASPGTADSANTFTYTGCRYAAFSMHAHPGPNAQVGWVLSDVSLEDMVTQLIDDPSATSPYQAGTNMEALDRVGRWLQTLPLWSTNAC